MNAQTVESKMEEQELLIKQLREELDLLKIEITDKDLLERVKGTFLLARIKLGIRLVKLGKELRKI